MDRTAVLFNTRIIPTTASYYMTIVINKEKKGINLIFSHFVLKYALYVYVWNSKTAYNFIHTKYITCGTRNYCYYLYYFRSDNI